MTTLLTPTTDDIKLQFHFNHGCLCARFNVKYTVYDCNGVAGPIIEFGNINMDGSGDIYDPQIKTIIKKDKCFSKVTFQFKCLKGLDSNGCTVSNRPPDGCHEGATGQFTQAGSIIADISIYTSTPQEIAYCQIVNNAP